MSPTLRSLKPPSYYGKDIGWCASWILSTNSKQSQEKLENKVGGPPLLLSREWKGAALVAVLTVFWRTVRKELDTTVTKCLWRGYFHAPSSQRKCFMVLFFMSGKKQPEDCPCVYHLPMTSQEPCTRQRQMEQGMLNHFPSLYQISVPPAFGAVGREAQELAYISSTSPEEM